MKIQVIYRDGLFPRFHIITPIRTLYEKSLFLLRIIFDKLIQLDNNSKPEMRQLEQSLKTDSIVGYLTLLYLLARAELELSFLLYENSTEKPADKIAIVTLPIHDIIYKPQILRELIERERLILKYLIKRCRTKQEKYQRLVVERAVVVGNLFRIICGE